MNIHNVSLSISAVSPKQYPDTKFPEIAFAGRSNVGKSSFINRLLNRKSLARTSSKPGKTATINFYNVDDSLHLVDLPGYGYAQVSKEEKKKWGTMIETYLSSREQLRCTALLVDARHKPTQDDINMLGWIRNAQGFALVFATKCDKIAKTKLSEHLDEIYYTLELGDDDIMIPFSAETGLGLDDAWEAIKELTGLQES
ncbi:MAG: YihA family ribosome biogenesis GTP-binding protein [Oscillospiraceae bacterium]|nr:YihA family ribosome biogenesis GTP-binding protein [Oscillospiraceae bacterium]